MKDIHKDLVDGYRKLMKENKNINDDFIILYIIEETIKLLTKEHIEENSIDTNVFNVYDKQYMRVLDTHQFELAKKGMGSIIR